jgi:hypothetical protein
VYLATRESVNVYAGRQYTHQARVLARTKNSIFNPETNLYISHMMVDGFHLDLMCRYHPESSEPGADACGAAAQCWFTTRRYCSKRATSVALLIALWEMNRAKMDSAARSALRVQTGDARLLSKVRPLSQSAKVVDSRCRPEMAAWRLRMDLVQRHLLFWQDHNLATARSSPRQTRCPLRLPNADRCRRRSGSHSL